MFYVSTTVAAKELPEEAPGEGDNNEAATARIVQLQKQLAEAATNNALKTTVLRRSVHQILFPVKL